MLCHRCGSQVPDNSEACATCGLKLTGAAAVAPRRRVSGVEAPFKPGDVFAKRYAIREVLGAGPVGHVFRVLDQEMEVEVALKVINPRLVQMLEERTQFSLALRTGRKLTHPLLVRVYEEGEERNRPFFTTQLLEGMTLRKMLDQRAAQGQHFTPREVEPLLVQLVDALNNAHKYGPHSNLKPENILVLPDLLKVTDYGLALGIPRLPFLQAQKAWRTACYVAPEYSEGGELDTRMDLYTLGVIVGEMLTGQVPEDGEMPDLLFHEPELPSGMEALYRRATNVNPLARPKSATEFLTEFTSAMGSKPRPASGRPVTGGTPAVKPRPKQVPLSLTAELAMAPQLSSKGLPPPVPTSELPTLGSPTIEMPAVGDEDGDGDEVTQTQTETKTQTETRPRPKEPVKEPVDAPRATLEAPRTTMESPRTTVETPRAKAEERSAAAPTELITTEQLEKRAAELSRERVPVDATQKLDSEALAAIMATARPNVPTPSSKPRTAPTPTPRAERSGPTPAPTASSAAASQRAIRTEPTPQARSSSWGMILLALVGLGLGVAGGYWLLKLNRASPEPPPAPAPAHPATPAPRPRTPHPSRAPWHPRVPDSRGHGG